ncbi:MAG TPA: fibronectin type III domain-containing protein [Negativicutes bacterium]|jgi:hypothetical protein
MLQLALLFNRTHLRHCLLLLSITFGIFLSISGASAAELVLKWDSPDFYTDGTPLDLGGFFIYTRTGSGNYSEKIDVGNFSSYKITGLENGSIYYFSVTAYDSFGIESDFSSELIEAIPVSPTPINTTSNLTISDAIISLKIAVGLLQPSKTDLLKFDLAPMVKGNPAPDGKIDISDALTILHMVIGL